MNEQTDTPAPRPISYCFATMEDHIEEWRAAMNTARTNEEHVAANDRVMERMFLNQEQPTRITLSHFSAPIPSADLKRLLRLFPALDKEESRL